MRDGSPYDEVMIVCERRASLPRRPRGAWLRRCCDCGAEVWVSGETLGRYVGERTSIRCLECVEVLIAHEPMRVDLHPPLEETVAAFRAMAEGN